MVDGQLGRYSKWFSQSMNVIEVGSVVGIFFTAVGEAFKQDGK